MQNTNKNSAKVTPGLHIATQKLNTQGRIFSLEYFRCSSKICDPFLDQDHQNDRFLESVVKVVTIAYK